MTRASLLTIIFLAAMDAGAARGSRLAQGQAEFNRGNFAPALKHLDAAAAESNDDATAAKIHLLRGQAFAAQQQFDDAEAAFARALAHDPEASLDPSRVDPKLVRMLDDLRDRTKAEVSIRTSVPGAAVKIDGQYVGQSPVTTQLSIGRHSVEAATPDGQRVGKAEIVVRPNRALEVPLSLEQVRDPPPKDKASATPAALSWRNGFVDLRANWNPFPLPGDGAFEVGAGIEQAIFRGGLHLRLFPAFGLIPRGALHVPITDAVDGTVELELPFIFTDRGVEAGLGAAGGAEYMVTKWIGLFGQVGFRYNFIVARSQQSQLYLQAGLRIRLPR